jgi:hypothetical protein
MKSIKEFGRMKICGLKVKKGNWYEVKHISVPSDIWLFKLYDIEGGYLFQEGMSFVLNDGKVKDSYSSQYPLCHLYNVIGIERVSLDYVRCLGLILD